MVFLESIKPLLTEPQSIMSFKHYNLVYSIAQIVTTQQSNSASTASAVASASSTMHHQSAASRIIPRLEDKYEINAALDELVANETHSEASYAR